ncbi:MAG TPA: carboxypeptidase regulatory-like domain-containing protein [Gemmatimonadaceae bacterium]|nr:carboxypeptidase regulatory-like domain-containing protein [Gemmatimonadaceae bacterium]
MLDSTPRAYRPVESCRIRHCFGAVSVGFAFVAAWPAASPAQAIAGRVSDEGGQPVAGVLIQLLDSASVSVGRALSNQRGEYLIRAPSLGSFRLRTLRIGYRPTTAALFVVTGRERLIHDVMIEGLPISLDTIRVVGTTTCHITSDTALDIYEIWEQARAALTATRLTETSGGITVTTVAYERVFEGNSQHVTAARSLVRTNLAKQPWASAGVEGLRRTGYVFQDGDSTTYLAPGLDVLLSDAFLEDHCFSITESSDAHLIGVAFRPARVTSVADIKGTLWLDRKSAELRTLEFGYTHLPAAQAAASGGTMDFARMRDGTWVIDRWGIRMPVLRTERWEAALESRVVEVHMAGGELALARRGSDTLWASPPLTITGVVRDSTSGVPITGGRVALGGTSLAGATDSTGRFRIAGVLPGEYALDVHTTSLDSIGAVRETPIVVTSDSKSFDVRVPAARALATAICHDANVPRSREASGTVIGAVHRPDHAPAAARVTAEWDEIATAGPASNKSRRTLDSRTDANGAFHLCGVPLGVAVRVGVHSDSVAAPPVEVTVPPHVGFAIVGITLERRPAVTLFNGVVLSDTTDRPIPGADVSLPELDRATRTDDHGVFHFPDVPVGDHRVVVRRVGYAPIDQTLRFAAAAVVNKRILLERVVTLDSVVSSASASAISSFEEHRKLGLGSFITRDELAKRESSHLSEILEQIRGVQVNRGTGNHAWVARSRGSTSISAGGVLDGDPQLGAKTACYAAVYLDGQAVYHKYGGTQVGVGHLFDVNSISPGQIEAIEYYAGPAETPPEYSGLNSTCGVLVIWTRRSP